MRRRLAGAPQMASPQPGGDFRQTFSTQPPGGSLDDPAREPRPPREISDRGRVPTYPVAHNHDLELTLSGAFRVLLFWGTGILSENTMSLG